MQKSIPFNKLGKLLLTFRLMFLCPPPSPPSALPLPLSCRTGQDPSAGGDAILGGCTRTEPPPTPHLHPQQHNPTPRSSASPFKKQKESKSFIFLMDPAHPSTSPTPFRGHPTWGDPQIPGKGERDCAWGGDAGMGRGQERGKGQEVIPFL